MSVESIEGLAHAFCIACAAKNTIVANQLGKGVDPRDITSELIVLVIRKGGLTGFKLMSENLRYSYWFFVRSFISALKLKYEPVANFTFNYVQVSPDYAFSSLQETLCNAVEDNDLPVAKFVWKFARKRGVDCKMLSKLVVRKNEKFDQFLEENLGKKEYLKILIN